jgi:hypothetical protein
VFAGRGTNVYFGGIKQRPRVSAETGQHKALGALGGWIQLSYTPVKGWTVLALAGIDTVRSGQDFGVSVDGTPAMKENRLLATSITKNLEGGLRFGVQFQQLQTKYVTLGTGKVLGLLADCSVNF